MISGTVGGGLCLWRGRNCCVAVGDAHGGAIETISVGDARGGIVASGGRDPKVLVSTVSLISYELCSMTGGYRPIFTTAIAVY